MTKNYHCGNLLSPALKELVDKKLAKLDKYELTNANVDVHMTKEGLDYVLKMQLQSDELNLLAKAKSNDMYKNIDSCMDRLTSQLKAQKERTMA